jgi:hypothetical protein
LLQLPLQIGMSAVLCDDAMGGGGGWDWKKKTLE